MTQVSRPMQIALAAVLAFAALWFVALKPKDDAAEPVAATPVTTPLPVEAGGEKAQTGVGQAIEAANDAAKLSNDTNAAHGGASGDTPQRGPGSDSDSGASAPRSADAKAGAGTSTDAKPATTARERAAKQLTAQVGRELKAGRAVVLLIADRSGAADRVMRDRVASGIARRNGKVKVHVIASNRVSDYEPLLGSLNIATTPSTVVIAPDHEAKVLSGLVSITRIDRLTSAAVRIKPASSDG